jgi:NAD(P)-dependent dehydrogenase (short-subunit alcohol dehydrogenase family)
VKGLDGKVAIITGGAAGIGRSTAIRLASEGVSVVVADLNIDGAEEIVGQLDAPGLAVEFDATDDESTERVVARAVERFGGLDILHNNVGVTANAWSTDSTLLETPMDVWDITWKVNVRSFVVISKAAVPHMLERGGGSIINMSSMAGDQGSPGLIAYGTTKAAVAHLTRYMAIQYGRQNIRTNAIAPGVIATEQLLENAPDLPEETLQTLSYPRVGEPEDVAALVAYLASDESQFINGDIIRIDGGQVAGSDPRPSS